MREDAEFEKHLEFGLLMSGKVTPTG
jgi:hypothetical protein